MHINKRGYLLQVSHSWRETHSSSNEGILGHKLHQPTSSILNRSKPGSKDSPLELKSGDFLDWQEMKIEQRSQLGHKQTEQQVEQQTNNEAHVPTNSDKQTTRAVSIKVGFEFNGGHSACIKLSEIGKRSLPRVSWKHLESGRIESRGRTLC